MRSYVDLGSSGFLVLDSGYFIFFPLLWIVSLCPTAFAQVKHPQDTPPRDFPGGAVVRSPPANSGDMGLRPGPGRSHMPQSN